MKKYRNIIIILLIFIIFGILLLTNNNSNITLDEVVLKEYFDNSEGIFAVYIEEESGDYVEYDGIEWPSGLNINLALSNCIDLSGNATHSLSYSDGVVKVEIGETSFCYLYFYDDTSDFTVITTVDGTESGTPISGSYVINTSTGSYYSERYRTLNITSISSWEDSKYTLAFTTDTSTKTNFRDYIISLLDGETSVISGNGYLIKEEAFIGDYTNATALAKSDYGATSQYYSSSAGSSSGTSAVVWNFDNDMWTNDVSSMSGGTAYNLSTTINTSGYYQMCYDMESGSSSNRLWLFIDGNSQYIDGSSKYISASTSSSKSGCINLGYIDSNSVVLFAHQINGSSTDPVEISLYLELGEEKYVGSAGYRYEGANPNNYVWFNNEIWRIIGVIPVETESGTENLVKIVRTDTIGVITYDSENSDNIWGSNTLYTLLNSYYWGASDGTGTSYCMRSSTYAFPNCDYTVIGVIPSGYYGNMVQYAYWNTGSTSYYVTPATAYANEFENQTVSGYVGIPNISDFGYAYYSRYHDSSIDDYDVSLNWFSNKNVLFITESGVAGGIFPTLYLSSDVYAVDGDGSESNPYILTIN